MGKNNFHFDSIFVREAADVRHRITWTMWSYINSKVFHPSSIVLKIQNLNLVSGIFYQIFILEPNNSLSKTEKCFLFHLKSSFHSRDIQFFIIFSLPFHTFQIQKDKWKWNDLWCHELACINLQMQFLE